jgi:hypothetical protein
MPARISLPPSLPPSSSSSLPISLPPCPGSIATFSHVTVLPSFAAAHNALLPLLRCSRRRGNLPRRCGDPVARPCVRARRGVREITMVRRQPHGPQHVLRTTGGAMLGAEWARTETVLPPRARRAGHARSQSMRRQPPPPYRCSCRGPGERCSPPPETRNGAAPFCPGRWGHRTSWCAQLLALLRRGALRFSFASAAAPAWEFGSSRGAKDFERLPYKKTAEHVFSLKPSGYRCLWMEAAVPAATTTRCLWMEAAVPAAKAPWD